ncbi:MAG: hypothetical protein EBV03_11165 [Proteobacteria bacterium]|nr:hypothetical protein [Pseudomonadota bacterium]
MISPAPAENPDITQLTAQLMPSFTKLADNITQLYRACGITRRCGIINGLWYPTEPGMGIDFVPPGARAKLEKLIRDADINLKISDGDRGEKAYFRLLKEGLTPEKLDNLSDRIAEEVLRITGPDGSPNSPGSGRMGR